MAWGGAPAELVAFWSKFLDDELDLAGYYSSEHSIRQELAAHPDIEAYADAAIQAWKQAQVRQAEIIDTQAYALAS